MLQFRDMSLTPYHEPGVGPAAHAQPDDAQAGEHVNPAGHPAADVPPAPAGVHGSIPEAGSSSGHNVCLLYLLVFMVHFLLGSRF